MRKPATITIEGRRYLWRDILALRKAQGQEARKVRRPAAERTAAGRYAEPTLFTLLNDNQKEEETP